MTWLIVGLGNPGKRFELSRHNMGFLVVDTVAQKEGIRWQRCEEGAVLGQGSMNGEPVVLAKPRTYMNRSGLAVERLARAWDTPLDRLLVVHDDLDLDFGRIKISRRAGHGGHRGVESIMERLGRDDFLRLRVGIGRPERPDDVVGYVLESFPPDQLSLLEECIGRASEATRDIILLGPEKAMSKYH